MRRSGILFLYKILLDNPMQEIDGFGACFNELGWTSLSELNSEDRENIIKDLLVRMV